MSRRNTFRAHTKMHPAIYFLEPGRGSSVFKEHSPWAAPKHSSSSSCPSPWARRSSSAPRPCPSTPRSSSWVARPRSSATTSSTGRRPSGRSNGKWVPSHFRTPCYYYCHFCRDDGMPQSSHFYVLLTPLFVTPACIPP